MFRGLEVLARGTVPGHTGDLDPELSPGSRSGGAKRSRYVPEEPPVASPSLSTRNFATRYVVLGAQRRHEAHLDDELLASLIGALKNAHRALTTPPDHIRSDPEELAKWVPRVRQSVNWDAVLRSRSDPESIGKLNDEHPRADEEFNLEDKEACRESPSAPKQATGPLTIGLIGTRSLLHFFLSKLTLSGRSAERREILTPKRTIWPDPRQYIPHAGKDETFPDSSLDA